MRILELCLSPDFGGLEINVKDFCYWLADQPECEVHVALQSRCRMQRALENLAAPTLAFDEKAGKLPLFKARRLAVYVERHKIDVVHVHWKNDLPLVALARRLCRRPFATVHTRHMNLPGRKHDPYHRFLYGSLDAFIAVTRYLAEQACRHLPMDPARVHQVHYGFTPPAAVTPEQVRRRRAEMGMDKAFAVGLIGRISHYKGQHLLIEAIDQLRRKGKSLQAWIVGEPFEPEYVNELEKMVTDRGLQDQVHFLGFQPNPHELIACFDTVVLTTRNETFGLVLIEAMHAGVAVAGSAEGGVPEIIDDEETGLLFETWNACGLAQALERLYDDPDLRQRLARTGQHKAREAFDRDRQNGKMLEVLRSVVESRRTRRAA